MKCNLCYRPPQQLCGIAVLRADRVEWPRTGRLFCLYSTAVRVRNLLSSCQQLCQECVTGETKKAYNCLEAFK